MSTEATVVVLFSIATAVAIAVRRVPVPYTVALVVAGLTLGTLHTLQPPALTRELLFTLLLPGLVFESAFHLDVDALRRNGLAIGGLAVAGVVLAIVLTGALVAAAVRLLDVETTLTLVNGLVFGSIVAATDPIAVVSLFRRLNVPARLALLVEGESLFNDGTAIVCFTLIVGAIAGASASAGALVGRFALIVGGGVIVGTLVGFAASRLTSRVDDPMIEITITTIAAYGSFALAEQLDYSGVLATVCAGVVCGNYGRRVGMSPSTRLAVETFWEYIAFALNSLVFLLLGFEVAPAALVAGWREILAAFIAATAGRAGAVIVIALLLARTRERIPRAWVAVQAWGGLRGALSTVLALSLPHDFPQRDLLVLMTFGMVILSILLQGSTMAWLLRRLGLGKHEGDTELEYARERARLQLADAAEQALDEMAREHVAHPATLETLRARCEALRERTRERLGAIHREDRELRHDELVRAARRLLLAERDRLLSLRRTGSLPQSVYDDMSASIDDRITRLDAGEDPEALLGTDGSGE